MEYARPPTMSRLRHVGHPDFDTRLAENAQVLLAPAPEPDEEDSHWPLRWAVLTPSSNR